jgi:hypothetical protein
VVDGVTANVFEHVLDVKEKEYSFRCLVIVSDLLEGGRLVKLGLGRGVDEVVDDSAINSDAKLATFQEDSGKVLSKYEEEADTCAVPVVRASTDGSESCEISM